MCMKILENSYNADVACKVTALLIMLTHTHTPKQLSMHLLNCVIFFVCMSEREEASQAPLRRCHSASQHSSAASNDT